jgi:formylmethanofuran dehydrogenase subunit B
MAAPGPFSIVLPFCGLPCSEAALTFEDGRVVGVRGGCAVCRGAAATLRFDGDPLIAGRGATLEEALDRAATMLREARRPFVYGLAASPVGTARLAARLAARVDAAIDVEGGNVLGPEIEAIAATGQVTATFGEMRAAADLVVLWRCDPRSTHPDFFPALPASGPATARGPRRIIAVPPCVRRDGELVLPIPDGRDVEALQLLRMFLNARRVAVDTLDGHGLPLDALRHAAEAILAARRVIILWDPTLPSDGDSDFAPAAVEASALAAGFAALTLDESRPAAVAGAAAPAAGDTERRSRPRIAVKALSPAHVTGGMAGLLSATGYPRAIGFSGGRPVCDPDRFGAERMLGGGSDLLLAIEPSWPLPEQVDCPVVLIGSRLPEDWQEPAVLLPIVPPALDGGLFLRSDGVPLARRLRRAADLDSVLGARPTESRVLEELLERLA